MLLQLTPRARAAAAVKMQVTRTDAQKAEIGKQHSRQKDLHTVIEELQKEHCAIFSTAADNKAKIEGAEKENTDLQGQLNAAEKAFQETLAARDSLKAELGAPPSPAAAGCAGAAAASCC